MKKIVYLIALLICITSGIGIMAQNPLLWGMTSAGGTDTVGTLFKINGDGTGFQSLQSLNASTGNTPTGTLLYANNNKFYGVTETGGANNKGTIFSLDGSNVFTDVHDFTGNAGNVPRGKLLQADNGNLYGMTFYDDSIGAGVIFKYNPATNHFAKLATFNGTCNGKSPRGSLMQASNGKIYGLCQGGGSSQLGTLFSFDTITNVITNLHSFITSTGFNPFSNLIEASNGLLYGLGMYFGTSGPGTIFSFNTSTNVFTDLIHFNTADGGFPEGSFIQASNGKLYGLASGGGTNAKGVLFSYDITGNIISPLVMFNGTNGNQPTGSLIEASNHKLYGMTSLGGANNLGLVFSYNITTSLFTDLFDFNATNGAKPNGALIEAMTPTDAGIESYSSENDLFSMYPNPSSGIFTLSSDKIKIKEIKVMNVMGMEIRNYESGIKNGNSVIIDLGNEAKGVYFMEITSSPSQGLGNAESSPSIVYKKIIIQ